MWREGRFQKGSFEDNSYGDSKNKELLTCTSNDSIAYRISAAHSISANIAYMEEAPSFQNSFVSPRTRNDLTPDLKTTKTFGAEIFYDINLKGFKARLTGYYTTIKDQNKVISFYDDLQSTFTNFAMSGIDKRHMGLEFGMTVPLFKGLNLNGAVSYGKHTYTSNPNITQTADNSAQVLLSNEKVYWKNYYVESTPQTAVNLGLSYRTSNNIFVSFDLNYYDAMYL